MGWFHTTEHSGARALFCPRICRACYCESEDPYCGSSEVVELWRACISTVLDSKEGKLRHLRARVRALGRRCNPQGVQCCIHASALSLTSFHVIEGNSSHVPVSDAVTSLTLRDLAFTTTQTAVTTQEFLTAATL